MNLFVASLSREVKDDALILFTEFGDASSVKNATGESKGLDLEKILISEK